MIGCESEIYSVSAIDEDFPITAKDIGKATVLDQLLAQLHTAPRVQRLLSC